jgi:hypothetical protein
MVADTSYTNLPPILDIVEPVIEEAPAIIQDDLADLIVALYRASANETAFMLKHVLAHSENPMTAITLRRVLPSLPPPLQNELRDLVRPQPLTRTPREPQSPAPQVVELEKPTQLTRGGDANATRPLARRKPKKDQTKPRAKKE